MDCSPPGSSVHGILQARILELGSHSLLQGIFLTQGSNPGLLYYKRILYKWTRGSRRPEEESKTVEKMPAYLEEKLQGNEACQEGDGAQPAPSFTVCGHVPALPLISC